MANLTHLKLFVLTVMVVFVEIRLEPIEPIHLKGDFKAQVAEILARWQLKAEDHAAIANAVASIRGVLQSRWPDAKLTPFGSVCSGLGALASDIDIFAELPHHHAGGPLADLAADTFNQHPDLFADIRVVGNTTRKLGGVHLPSSRHFEISFKGPLSLRNTLLLRHLLNDPKIVNMVVILKYWASVRSLHVTNYIFALMVIFFLQQKHIFPPIAELQKHERPMMVDHWNTAFEANALRPVEQDLLDLLKEFFEYYAKFDFENDFVSPYVGRPVKRALFENVDRLSDFELYKHNLLNNITSGLNLSSALVVQDPFEHNRSVGMGSSTLSNVPHKIIMELKIASQKCNENNNPDEFLKLILQK